MNLTDAPFGYAFEGDYPESYGHGTPALRAVVEQQVGRLSGSVPAADERLLGILIGRRSGLPQRAQPDLRPRRDNALALVARGEVVMSVESYRLAPVNGIVKDFAQQSAGGAVRLRNLKAGRSDVDGVIDRCTSLDVPAWHNYMTQMAAVGKGIGGPENAPALGDFTNYQIPGAAAGGGSGRRITVAVIDTGIQRSQRSDHWLNEVPRSDANVDKLDLLPSGPDGFLDYQAGHGTFVAGIIARVAPKAKIRVYRAADSDGIATDEDIAAMIVQAHRDGAEVINLSLGGRTLDDRPPQLMRDAIDTVHREAGQDEQGRNRKVIVAAAGNYGTTGPIWPASLPGVEAVAGLTAYLTPVAWSSYGDVRFSTVAEGIHSVFPEGTESPLFDPQPDTFGPNAGAIWSGTSFAAPQVAGAVARIVAEQGIEPRAAVDLLDERGKAIPGFGKAMRILQGLG
jgi:subtilisin family serine protease